MRQSKMLRVGHMQHETTVINNS